MTLREYLEQNAQHYMSLCQEYQASSHDHWFFLGRARMCTMMLRDLDDATLMATIKLEENTNGRKDL